MTRSSQGRARIAQGNMSCFLALTPTRLVCLTLFQIYRLR
jgi:hypothetical protein